MTSAGGGWDGRRRGGARSRTSRAGPAQPLPDRPGVIARPPTASGRRPATGSSRRASVARRAAAAATSGEIAAAPAPREAARARLPQHPSQQRPRWPRGRRPRRRFAGTASTPKHATTKRAAPWSASWDGSAGRAAGQPQRVPHARYAAYSGKENQWKNTGREVSWRPAS